MGFKQHITPKQAKELTQEQFYELFGDLVWRKDWANYHHKKVTIGKLIETIRGYYQMDIYTVNKDWCLQLFEQDICANDGESCVYEDSDEDLVDVLFTTILWIIEDRSMD